MTRNRFLSAAFVFCAFMGAGTMQVAHADDPLKQIVGTIMKDRSHSKCGDVPVGPSFGPFFSRNAKLEAVAQAYARAEKQVPQNNLAGYGTIVAFLGTGDPEAQAINLAYKRGAGPAIADCKYKEFGVGFSRDGKREIDFVTIVLGIPTPPPVTPHTGPITPLK